MPSVFLYVTNQWNQIVCYISVSSTGCLTSQLKKKQLYNYSKYSDFSSLIWPYNDKTLG